MIDIYFDQYKITKVIILVHMELLIITQTIHIPEIVHHWRPNREANQFNFRCNGLIYEKSI